MENGDLQNSLNTIEKVFQELHMKIKRRKLRY
jgi:hypothetical protein